MAHLWVANPEGDWTANDLEEEEVLVGSSTAGGGSADDSARIRRCGPTDGRQWALISPIRSMIRVNGRSVPGVRVLADRDELFVPLRGRLFFSTERLAGVESFEGRPGTCCPLCKLAIDVGTPAVRCPGCGVYHHQNERRACWGRRDTCIICRHPTALDGNYRWTPRDL